METRYSRQLLLVLSITAFCFAACDDAGSPDPCENVTCSGRGVCVEVDNAPTCNCFMGYHADGLNCEEDPAFCNGVTCSDHGTCVDDGLGNPRCICEDGFTEQGLGCYLEDSSCIGIICSGHGICVESDGGDATCECDTGYTEFGLSCYADDSACIGITCSGHGVCTDENEGEPSCTCDEGYYPRELECLSDAELCADVTCSDHGICISTDGQPACDCEEGYAEDGLNCRSITRNLDAVIVIDTSSSMADEHVIFQGNLANFINTLSLTAGGLPNLHIGMITPDLGTSPYNIPGCVVPGGDQGRFWKGLDNACANPINQTYLVDVEPRGCNIQKYNIAGQATTCSNHDCTQANCDQSAFENLEGLATEPAGLMFRTDSNGCPRCRNYTNEELTSVLQCMAQLGTDGCGLEQPLEAAYRAISDPSGPNSMFLRDNAYLSIIFVTDEDDCSTSNTELFNPVGDINSPLGTLTSFRCTEFGVVCDQPWQRIMPQGQLVYDNCVPRETDDQARMLYPNSRYTDGLLSLKDGDLIFVSAIAGPYSNQLTVGLDNNQNPRLLPTCGILTDGGDPAVRIKAFMQSFLHDPTDISWAFSPICSTDFNPALEGLANRIKELIELDSAP